MDIPIYYPCLDCSCARVNLGRPVCILSVTKEGMERYQHEKFCPFRENVEREEQEEERLNPWLAR